MFILRLPTLCTKLNEDQIVAAVDKKYLQFKMFMIGIFLDCNCYEGKQEQYRNSGGLLFRVGNRQGRFWAFVLENLHKKITQKKFVKYFLHLDKKFKLVFYQED